MKEIKVNRDVLVLYDNTDELPIKNYNLMNQYSLLDYEIGQTLDDVNRHFAKMDALLGAGKMDEAIQARKNLHQTFWNMINGTNFPVLQFGCFVKSVNGEEMTDYSKENIEKVIGNIKGLSIGVVKETIDQLKKK